MADSIRHDIETISDLVDNQNKAIDICIGVVLEDKNNINTVRHRISDLEDELSSLRREVSVWSISVLVISAYILIWTILWVAGII